MILINRYAQQPSEEPRQTLGDLYFYKGDEVLFQCKTLELAWDANKPYVSCIPPDYGGEKEYHYQILEQSQKFDYPHLWIKDVPDRSYIKVHRGNAYTQIEGCILVGETLQDVMGDDLLDVTSSELTLNKLIGFCRREGEGKIVIGNNVMN